MTRRAVAAAALAIPLVALASSCVTYRGPRGLESAIEDQMGVELEREFGLKLGWTSTRLAAALVGPGDGDDPLDLSDVTGLGVAVFTVPDGAGPTRRLDPRQLRLRGFEVVLQVRDSTDQVLLLAKPKGGAIHEMVLVTVDDDEVILARLRGRLDEMIEKLTRGAGEHGAKGARDAVPIASAD